MKRIILLLCLALGTPGNASQSRRHWPYRIEIKQAYHTMNGDHTSVFNVRLKNIKSGRLVWTRTTRYAPGVEWSKDHRAVAIEAVPDGLFIWREGEAVHHLGMPNDYFMGCLWSPDKQFLLVRGGNSADIDFGPHGVGSLYCLKLSKGNISNYMPVAKMVWKVTWQGKRTVRYWTYTMGDAATLLKSNSHLRQLP